MQQIKLITPSTIAHMGNFFCTSQYYLRCLFFGFLILFNGCAITPDSIVKQPTTARAYDPPATAANSGAIFNAKAYHPIFEDRRPRYIGDIVTINITENTTATKAGASSGSKSGAADFATNASIKSNVPIVGGVASKLPFGNLAAFSASSANSFADKAAENASNVFTGSITATVIEVLPNGYLVVSGDKQVSFDKGTEFVRFSGVVNPDTITLGNFVTSNKVADARIEYRTNSKIDAAAVASIFARFFLSITPW
ncbi:MAG: flagellar basal body L-ring protein FlgH [Pseudomonadota bacterium]